MTDDATDEVYRKLARETGRALGELGVRASDEKWIREHAETIASLSGRRRGSPLLRHLRRVFARSR